MTVQKDIKPTADDDDKETNTKITKEMIRFQSSRCMVREKHLDVHAWAESKYVTCNSTMAEIRA